MLKQRNSNRIVKVSYNTGNNRGSYFTMSASVSAGYRLSKRFQLIADISSSLFNPDITYTKTIRDIEKELETVEQFNYNNTIISFGAGAGLIFTIWLK
jgi:hypothetical protein